MPKLFKLPKNITATFATVEIGKGRDVIQKLIEADYKIPFTLKGYLNPGKSNVGSSDDVGTEFGAETESIVIGVPEFMALDKAGRPWAEIKKLEAGDKLQCDGGFDCMKSGSKLTVKLDELPKKLEVPTKAKPLRADYHRRLYVTCADGKHYLRGQVGDYGELIGFYKVGK